MTALPSTIIRASRRARIVTLESTAIRDAFPGAQDQSLAPEPGFFESAASATATLVAKQGLVGTFRRRFAPGVDGVFWIDAELGVPTYRLIDAELGFDGPVMVARWQLDLEAEQTEMEVIG